MSSLEAVDLPRRLADSLALSHVTDPVFKQTAWSTLVWNNSLPFTSPAQPIYPRAVTALPSAFESQMDDVNSPLYLDRNLPSVLLDLEGSNRGIEKWSRMIGVRHEDLWSVCAFTFFCICAAVVAAHALFFAFDSVLDTIGPKRKGGRGQRASGAASAHPPPFRRDDTSFSVQKESISDNYEGRPSDASLGRYLDSGEYEEENFVDESAEYDHRPEDDFPSWRLHLALVQGNLTRVLVLFHLPLTIFSVYEFTLRSTSSTSTFALAIVVFAAVCVAWPVYLIWIIHVKPARELYTSLPLLLSTGVLYNTYAEECCLFPVVTFASSLIVGVVIGATQSSGTAQTAVILLVEVASTVCQSLWLPWGDNSAMGPLAFLLSLARIVTAVLLVVLSPTVAISNEAGSWIAYIVFLVQGLVILLLVSVLVFKFFELVVRVVGRVPFDESRSGRGGGLFGALRKLDRVRGGKKGQRGGGSRNTRAGGGGGAARKRAIEARRRRNRQQRERLSGPSETTVGTRTHMLAHPARPGHASPGSSMSLDTRRYASSGLVDEDGYIMASMGSGAWTGSESSRRTGYVKPGAYASSAASAGGGGPVLRNAPAAWGEHSVTLVPATAAAAAASSTTSSGFTRVGGGRATHKNPYDYTSAAAATTAYPPYPPASSDAYGGPPTASAARSSMPGNPRRMSQSAIVEMANAGATADSPPLSRHGTRPSLQLPSSSALLTNTVSHYSNHRFEDEQLRRDQRSKPRGGFFGRFKKRRATTLSDDDFTDDTDDTDDEGGVHARRRWRGLNFGGAWKRARGAADDNDDNGTGYGGDERVGSAAVDSTAPETGEKGFSVVRKPRPRPAAPPVTTAAPPLSSSSAEVERLADSVAANPSDRAPPPPSTDAVTMATLLTPTAESSDPLLSSSTRSPPTPSLPPGAAPPQPHQPPHVSVEAPSRPTSLRGESFGFWEDR